MEYLYLKWNDYKTNTKYLIGALFRDKEKGKYYFKLSKTHIENAVEKGVISKAIIPFSDFNKIYESDNIFSIFKIRLPNIERYSSEELQELLSDLDMDEFDEFEYLKKTNGILATDNFIVEEEN